MTRMTTTMATSRTWMSLTRRTTFSTLPPCVRPVPPRPHHLPHLLAEAEGAADVVRARSYDIALTYDKYYLTPRVWLFGYSESQQPLSAADMFMDISADHAHKTVTLEVRLTAAACANERRSTRTSACRTRPSTRAATRPL